MKKQLSKKATNAKILQLHYSATRMNIIYTQLNRGFKKLVIRLYRYLWI